MEKIFFLLFNLISNLVRIMPFWLRALGAHFITWLMMMFGHDRNNALDQNLSLCINGINEYQKVLTKNFKTRYRITYYHATVLLDYLSTFSMSQEELQKTVEVIGGEDLPAGGLIYFPHFIGLSLGSWLTTRIYNVSLIYSPPKQKVLANWMESRFDQLIHGQTYKKNNSIAPLAKLLKKGKLVQLSTDLDVGDRDAILSNFFNIPAFTSKSLPVFIDKFCPNLIGAVCIYICDDSRNSFRYRLHFEPIALNLNSISHQNMPREQRLIEIQNQLNHWLENKIRQYPLQYWWFHKRFKTAKAKGII